MRYAGSRLSIIVTAAVALGPSAAGATPPHWQWSGAVALPGGAGSMTSLSCPSATLCTATSRGSFWWTTAPLGAPSAWRHVGLTPRSTITSGSCPAPTFCALADDRGKVLTSSLPEDGAATWTRTPPAAPGPLRAIYCSSGSLCAALDDSGNVLTSPDPGSPAPSWSTSTLSRRRHRPQYGIACAGLALCLAVDTTPVVAYTTDPGAAAPSRHWEKLNGPPLRAVSCPEAQLCVAVGGWGPRYGRIAVSRDPAGGEQAWRSLELGPGARSLAAVSCRSASLCLATDGSTIFSSSAPAARGSSWQRTAPHSPGRVTTISCPTNTSCLLGTSTGRIVIGRLRR